MNKRDLLEQLKHLDETLLIDLLGLTSEEIVDAFIDRIVENYGYIEAQVENMA